MLKRSIKIDKILVVVLLVLIVWCISSGIRYMNNNDMGTCIFFVLLSAFNGTNLHFTVKRLFERRVDLEVVKVLYDFSGEIKSKIEIDIETKQREF